MTLCPHCGGKGVLLEKEGLIKFCPHCGRKESSMSNNHRERLAPEAELTLHVLYPFQIIMEDYDPRVGQSFERWARNMAALVCIWNTLPEADRKLQASRFTGELHAILMDFVLAVAERARKVRDRLQQQDQG